jgi:hypothetical protein
VAADGCPLLVFTSAVSRAVHGDQGPFDIDLLGPEIATEMRMCEKQIVIGFAEPLEACDESLDDEVVVNVGTVSGLSLAGSELTIDLIDVPDPSCLKVHVSGLCTIGGSTPMTSETLSLIILGGDVNGSGGVTIADMSRTKKSITAVTDAYNFHIDVNCSGGITISDLSNVKAKNQTGGAGPGPCP